MELQRWLGLRFKESVLLNAKHAYQQAKICRFVDITNGTKGGRKRTVPVNANALSALEKAISIQNGHSLIPKNQSYKAFRNHCYQIAVKHGFNFHSERHAYAQRRYQELARVPALVTTQVTKNQWLDYIAEHRGVDQEQALEIDSTARLQVSEELGHSREEVTRVYIG
jgi:integrase